MSSILWKRLAAIKLTTILKSVLKINSRAGKGQETGEQYYQDLHRDWELTSTRARGRYNLQRHAHEQAGAWSDLIG